MNNKKCIILIVMCVIAVSCILGLSACKSNCKHLSTREEITSLPTCTGTGIRTVYCNDCNVTVRNETVDSLGHDFSVVESETQANCLIGGSKVLKCVRCSETQTQSTSGALSHDFTVVLNETPSTCSAVGQKTLKCSRCNETKTETLEISPDNHNFGEWTADIKPTLNNNGMLIRICEHNKTHVETKEIPSLSTNGAYEVSVTKQATCESAGICVYSSGIYGTYEIEIPRNAHTFDSANETFCKTCGQKYYSAGLKYELSEDKTYYTVSSGNLTDNDVVIPSEYDGIPVKAIASEGFAYKTWIHSVTIPEYVEQIGSGAFNGSGITKVYYNAIKCADFKQKNWVFLVSGNLEVVIGRQVEHIPARMFYPLVTGDTTVNVTKLTFEDGSVCKTIGEYAFNKTSLSGQLIIPDSVQSIGNSAFYNTDITKLILGNGVTSLGVSCFGANSKLREIEFGKNLTNIPNDCFNYCIELTNADLSATKVGSIGDDAFKGCAGLKTVVLSDTVVSIGKQAFFDCASLNVLSLGKVLESIDRQAFANCASLVSLTLPKTLKILGNAAFSNCTALAEINFNAACCGDLEKSNMTFANIGVSGKLKVVFGSEVEYIPARLFYCSADTALIPKIDSLYLGASIGKIGDYAFMGVCIGEVGLNGLAWNEVIVGSGNTTLNNAVK